MENKVSDYPYIIFRLASVSYGISCEHVKNFEIYKNAVPIPNVPQYVRGIINIRGKIIHVIDLRLMLGLQSIEEEINDFQELLNKRKQDHINWLTALEASVNEHYEFRLTTNPHECAFGKWYDSYKTNNDTIRYILDKFDEPHKRIHAIADEVQKCQNKGDYDKAHQIINRTRKMELNQMIDLFSMLGKEYENSRREIIMILECGEKTLGLIVDEVVSLEPVLDCEEVQLGNRKMGNNQSVQVAKRSKDNTPVLLIGIERFLEYEGPMGECTG